MVLLRFKVLCIFLMFLGSVTIVEDPLNCFGLCSSFCLQCDGCEMSEFFSTGKHELSDSIPRTIKGKDVNRRAIFACNEVGIGREGLSTICVKSLTSLHKCFQMPGQHMTMNCTNTTKLL